MAEFKVRYLVVKAGRRHGELPRYFWQPSAVLRKLGFEARRVPDNWREVKDARELEAAAIAEAQELNADLDRRRPELEGAAAVTRRRPASSGARTVNALVDLYKKSEDYADLAPATRRGYDQCLERVSLWAGDAPVRVVTAKRVQVLKKNMRATPSFANAVIRVLRLLLEFGIREEWLVVNAARKPKLLGTDPSGLCWPRAAVDLFVAAADRLERWSIGTAVLVDEWIGQREGDVLRLPRRLVQRNLDGTVTLRQRKGGVAVSLPIGAVPRLVGRCEEELARLEARFKDAAVQPATLIVSEATGQPYKEDYFRHEFARVRLAMADGMRAAAGFRKLADGSWWSDEVAARLDNLAKKEQRAAMAAAARRAAAFEVDYLMPGRDSEDPEAFLLYVEDLQFMHLRHTAVTRLAEAECSDELISVITGHSLASIKTILKRYLVRTRKLATLAFQKRLAAEGAIAPSSSRAEGGQ